jgi:hypothetical protein
MEWFKRKTSLAGYEISNWIIVLGGIIIAHLSNFTLSRAERAPVPRYEMEACKMSVPCKFERSLLSHDEYETIRLTHHPAIYDVEPAELEALRSRLRKMRAKEQTLCRQKRREARGASFPGTTERPLQRKQVFASALKRINKELERLHNLAARTAHVEAARQALALHRAANFIPYPSAGATASEGMAPRPSRRRKTIIGAQKSGAYHRP